MSKFKNKWTLFREKQEREKDSDICTKIIDGMVISLPRIRVLEKPLDED